MFRAIILILIKHLQSKWARILLAQAGIMIGIWAISLTTSLSLGLSDKIVTAINSQPGTKEISVYRVEGDKSNFFELSGPPKFILLGQQDMEKIKQNVPQIVDVAPFANAVSYIHTQQNSAHDFACVTTSASLIQQVQIPTTQPPQPSDNTTLQELDPQTLPKPPTQEEIEAKRKELDAKCLTFSMTANSWQSYYNTNEKKLIGEKRKPGRNEISICFKCGSTEFGKKLGANTPQELLGKEIILEFKQSIEFHKAGDVFDVLESNTLNPNRDFKESKQVKFKVISVIDDEKVNQNILSGGDLNNNYVDFSHFEDEMKRVEPGLTEKDFGYLQLNAVIDNYNNLDSALEGINKQKYLSFSTSQLIVSSIKTLFTVFTYFLAGFGLIVLIASVFGIVNVMTISVLERKKEIGIIKSLGANNTHIFWIFLLESMFLGVLGWLFGTLLAFGSGFLISRSVLTVLNQNADWKSNLEQFNITDFNPSFPPTLLLSTLALSIFFTVVSGLIPAIRASRQHIVEVLRSE